MSGIPSPVKVAFHLTGLPVRYAVGRWCNLSSNTLVIFNAVDLGLITLMRSVDYYIVKKYQIKASDSRIVLVSLSTRTVACIVAYYTVSLMNHPISASNAALTTAAAFIAMGILANIMHALYHKNSDQGKQPK